MDLYCICSVYIVSWISPIYIKKLKDNGIPLLANKNVLVVGLGGVGSYTAELLARSGLGRMTIVDADTISITNINRQLPALPSTIGKYKTDIIKERCERINPQMTITAIPEFLEEENTVKILKEKFDYVVDAIDSVTPKVFLIKHAITCGIPIVSSMGAGGRMDPSTVHIADISMTYKDHLGKVVRTRLRKQGVHTGVKCVFSSEEADKTSLLLLDQQFKRSSFGTISYMTSFFGTKCAEIVIRDLIGDTVVCPKNPDCNTSNTTTHTSVDTANVNN
ncbi:Ubiquitin-activating enzyme E1 [Entamoeba marina]